ncbi:MAG TPA: hypothetical protein VH144_02230 [Candidatus Saccharimonadales bacterium]|nr:hypothetical protein [Candidatus Saccharimonadales bacterium]
MTNPFQMLLNPVQQFAARQVFQAFAKKYDLVYFGYVNQHNDEHELVRGITLSARHADRHYCVGHFQGRDLIALLRTDTVVFPGKPTTDYSWAILQIDLERKNLPHIFIDANHHDETFYANLFVKFSNFRNINNQFSDHIYDQQFAKAFKIYTPPDEAGDAQRILTPDVSLTLLQQFRHFDFEIFDDRLLIYASNAALTPHTLEQMLRAGIWLAAVIDQYHLPEQLPE